MGEPPDWKSANVPSGPTTIRVGEGVEDRGDEAVALPSERLERLPQRRAHCLERAAEVRISVSPAGALERAVELTLADLVAESASFLILDVIALAIRNEIATATTSATRSAVILSLAPRRSPLGARRAGRRERA